MSAGLSTRAMRPQPAPGRPAPQQFVRPAAPATLHRGGYVAALDGIRALAALAVLVYHLGLGYLPGGLLGVDVFFVLSGFLITALLLGEHDKNGRIGLRSFWVRRLRRLLPALLLVLVVVAGYAAWAADPSQRGSIRADALSTLGYVANWRFALSHQSYFHGFDAPSPLLHTWSLGVEEQFYVLWPLVVVLVLRLRPGRRAGARLVGGVATVGAAASAIAAGYLAETGADASRVYYGTDTRCQALLIGAAAAAYLAARPAPTRAGATRSWRWSLSAMLGVVGVGVSWAMLSGQSPLLDRGGFLLVALASVAVVAAVSEHPQGVVARVLSFAPLRAIGRMSYGVYLWHWPLFLLIDHARTGLSGGALAGSRVAVTLVVAAASYRFVERPVRQGALARLGPARLGPLRLVAVPVMALVTVLALVVTGTAGGVSSTAELSSLAVDVNAAGGAPPSVAPLSAAVPLAAAPRAGTSAAAAPVPAPRLLVVGDSVALTFAGGLTPAIQRQYGVEVANRGWVGCGVARNSQATDGSKVWPAWPDCAVWPSYWSRWVDQMRPDVAALLAGRWEVVDRLMNGRWTHLGNPDFDAYIAGELDTAVSTLSARGAKVVLFTAPYYRPTELPDGRISPADDPHRVDRFNQLLREAAARHPRVVARVIDLNALLCPAGRFAQTLNGITIRYPSDGIHITVAGDAMIAKTILPEIRRIAENSSTTRAS